MCTGLLLRLRQLRLLGALAFAQIGSRPLHRRRRQLRLELRARLHRLWFDGFLCRVRALLLYGAFVCSLLHDLPVPTHSGPSCVAHGVLQLCQRDTCTRVLSAFWQPRHVKRGFHRDKLFPQTGIFRCVRGGSGAKPLDRGVHGGAERVDPLIGADLLDGGKVRVESIGERRQVGTVARLVDDGSRRWWSALLFTY
jgi:hypothetical protein